MTNISEKILLYRIRAKSDAEAFAELYDKYVERIYRFVYIKISHKHDAEDITSDVFLKTWNYLTSQNNDARHIKSFSGLIYSIARNLIIDWYRDMAKKQTCNIDEIGAIIENPYFAENLDATYRADKIVRLIKTLKQEYQEVILLKYIDELSITEISNIVGKKRTAVRVTLHRAMKKLKIIIEEEEEKDKNEE